MNSGIEVYDSRFPGNLKSKDCPDVYYGIDCSVRCSQNCQGGYCNFSTGNCLHCPQGYQGQQCDVEDKDTISHSMFIGFVTGLGVSCVAIIYLLIVICALICRVRQARKNKRRDNEYDGLRTGNEYQNNEDPNHYQMVQTRSETFEVSNGQLNHVYNNEDTIANNEYETIRI